MVVLRAHHVQPDEEKLVVRQRKKPQLQAFRNRAVIQKKIRVSSSLSSMCNSLKEGTIISMTHLLNCSDVYAREFSFETFMGRFLFGGVTLKSMLAKLTYKSKCYPSYARILEF